ncbi:hypothetical protein CI238_11903 [Colletotrichum incanum]|uniref:Uncharacterized protein n=1 Tax=Colletotrichum incanum TaxID=1573173 RepID=A0A167ASC0_COLIC|nr:hypothetical protein CI238_11903 [Colletotrichum incanum]
MSFSDFDASDASVASGTFVRSCIFVELLPEDLDIGCTADFRPHEPPAEPGLPGSFTPFDVRTRSRNIRELPAAPLDLFLRYVSQSLVEQWG